MKYNVFKSKKENTSLPTKGREDIDFSLRSYGRTGMRLPRY